MHKKAMGRLAGAAILFGCAVTANLGAGAATEGGSLTVEMSASDVQMSHAEDAARKSFERFLTHVVQPDGAARIDAAVKIALEAPDGSLEVIWVTPFARMAEDRFLGQIANAPQTLPDIAFGDAIRFTHAQVRDWSFVGPDGKLYGSFTTRVLLPHLEEAQAQQISEILSEAPTPANW